MQKLRDCFNLFWYSEDHQLYGASGVSFRRHGPPQRLHGGVIGAPEQRLAVHSDQLVVDGQPTVLLGKDE